MTFLENIKQITNKAKEKRKRKQNILLDKEIKSIISSIVKAAKRGQESVVWEPFTEEQAKIAVRVEKYFKEEGFSIKTERVSDCAYKMGEGYRPNVRFTHTISWEE